MGNVSCTVCNTEIDPALDVGEIRTPCPGCGATSRREIVSIEDRVELGEIIDAKHFEGGKSRTKGLKAHSIDGVRIGSDRPHFVRISQLVDKENDWYKKKVVDTKTGEVIRDVKHPLSEHRDRGSARPQAPDDSSDT